jgi:flagellar biosynthesis protein FlhA
VAEPIALGAGISQGQRWRRVATMAVPLSVVAVVVVLVVPLPTFVVDLLITANITGSILILLTAMQVQRPLDFSVFPTLVLVATMFRLALNVAATRLILLHGYAGVVIESFGHFVIGGSILVGLVVFFILIVIQFVVITSGAGRVAEVAARFTLDGMPGKQMAIDADLHAGAIDEAEARRRRQEVADEADFYGAMDGASKFVRGDAIAAIVITAINLIGGLAIGVVQHHLSLSDAISTYSLLSVGDGLVSQVPALLLSLSTGIIVTRAATEHNLGHDVLTQLSRYRPIVRTTGLVMGCLAIIPGLPKLPFLIVGGGVFFFGTRPPRRPSRSRRRPWSPPTRPSRSPLASRWSSWCSSSDWSSSTWSRPNAVATCSTGSRRCDETWRRSSASSCHRCTRATTSTCRRPSTPSVCRAWRLPAARHPGGSCWP